MSKKIAAERIERLFKLANRRMRQGEPELADRYVEIARRIGMSHRVSIPRELRKEFCHDCYSYLLPGKNCQVRINSKNSTVNYRCDECGHVNRYGFEGQ